VVGFIPPGNAGHANACGKTVTVSFGVKSSGNKFTSKTCGYKVTRKTSGDKVTSRVGAFSNSEVTILFHPEGVQFNSRERAHFATLTDRQIAVDHVGTIGKSL
jgi:hypothetical protein